MEKRNPHYALETIQATFCEAGALRLTRTAQRCSEALGMTRADVVQCIQGLGRANFYKSMTSRADHRIWQDVYHAHFQSLVLYVKFTLDPDGYLLISFKDKDD